MDIRFASQRPEDAFDDQLWSLVPISMQHRQRAPAETLKHRGLYVQHFFHLPCVMIAVINENAQSVPRLARSPDTKAAAKLRSANANFHLAAMFPERFGQPKFERATRARTR